MELNSYSHNYYAFLVWTGTTQPSAFNDDAMIYSKSSLFHFPAVHNIKMAEGQASEFGVHVT
jgi:hypothetical protein